MCEPARSPCGGGRVAVGGGWAEVARELELANSQVPGSVGTGPQLIPGSRLCRYRPTAQQPQAALALCVSPDQSA